MDRIVLAFLTVGLVTANVCSAQSVASPVPVPFKDPKTALAMSIVAPGGGQLYAGEIPKGLLMLVGGEGALIAGWSTSQRQRCSHGDCTGPHWGNLYVGAAAALGIWFYSMADAPGAARRYNAKVEKTQARLEPVITRERIGATVSF